MKTLAEGGVRTPAFWILVVVATLETLTNAANNPVVPRIVRDLELGDSTVAGMLVSLSAVGSIIAMPLSGILTDRFGAKKVVLYSTIVAVLGLGLAQLALLSVDPTVLAASRFVFGAGNAATATALAAWVMTETPAGQRGRSLGLFGLSVWVGMALGPQLGEALYHLGGSALLWTVCMVALAAGGALAIAQKGGHRVVHSTPAPVGGNSRGAWLIIIGAILLPGLVALCAWGSEAFMATFLIQHLEVQGVPSQGLFGGASVFTVFAATVIIARIAFAGMTDRLGPTRTAQMSLLFLAAGLLVISFADTFAVAAIGGVLIGFGFSPLYPALILLATSSLDPRRRSTGLGIFNGFTSIGWGLGAAGGGALVDLLGEGGTFAVMAGVQVVAVLIVQRIRRIPTTGPADEIVAPPEPH